MVNSIQEKQSEFSFNYWIPETKFNWILWILLIRGLQIHRRIFLMECEVTLKEFWTLKKKLKELRIRFNSWVILTDWECELGEMKEWKVQILDRNNTENKENSSWMEDEGRFGNILCGINKNEGLLKSIVVLSIKIQDYERGIKKLLRSINSKFLKIRNIKKTN